MPWDASRLRVADVLDGGRLGAPRTLAGGPAVSIAQPAWSPSGVLHAVSDETGWWNLYRFDGEGGSVNLAPMDAELADPAWVFGQSSYAFGPDGVILASARSRRPGRAAAHRPGRDGHADPDAVHRARRPRDHRRGGGGRRRGAARRTRAPAAGRRGAASRSACWPARCRHPSIPASCRNPRRSPSRPRAAPPRVPCTSRRPTPPSGRPTASCRRCSSCPTAARPARRTLRCRSTARSSRRAGIAVVDVDYRGSTGYGRPYRDALNGQWGIVDVDDCVAAARFLAGRGSVDGQRMAIRGGSAGGFTTLAASRSGRRCSRRASACTASPTWS